MDRPRRRIVRPPSAQKRRGVAAEIVRDRESRELLPEHRDEPEVGIVQGIERAVECAAERLEHPDVAQAPVPGRREPAELHEYALSRWTRDEGSGGTKKRLRTLVHAETELVLEPDRAKETKRVVEEHHLRDRPDDTLREIRAAVVRIARSARAHPDRDRVEREVARREIGRDAVRKGCEVDRLRCSFGDDAPGAVALGERECRTAEAARVAVRGLSWIAAGDVDVEHRTAEELVAYGTAHDPRLLALEHLADALIHLSPLAAPSRSGC